MSSNNPTLEDLRHYYDDVEIAILCDWLGVERPDELVDVNLEESRQVCLDEETPGPIRLVDSLDGYGEHNALANAVARIALNAIADRLPQWSCTTSDGQLAFARATQPRRQCDVDPLPRFLLMINWADSGPGFSWPESYHATYLPGFDRFVVTLSDDSPEVHGYTDIGIAHFSASADFDDEIKRVIIDLWSERGLGDPEFAWQHLFSEGYVDSETAYEWRARVWAIGPDDELIDEDEEEEA